MISAHWVETAFEVRYQPQVSTPAKLLARLKHDAERSPRPQRNFITDPIPQPFRAKPDQTIPINTALQNLLCELNPEYTRERALQLLGTGLCWCNQTTNVFSAAIVTGGAVMEVVKQEPGRVYVNSILVSDPAPTKQYVLDNHLSTIATSVGRDGIPGFMTRPNGHGSRSLVRMFIVRKTVEPIWFASDEVQLLGFEPPSAVWMP